MGGDIAIYIGIGGNEHIVPHGNTTNDNSPRSNPDPISQNRSSLSFPSIFLPDSAPLMKVAVRANSRAGIHIYAISMPKVYPRCNIRTVSKIDSVFRA